ncbi:MAG TPA: hypothetical protein VF384_12125 [Planctomycetota bacterium]
MLLRLLGFCASLALAACAGTPSPPLVDPPLGRECVQAIGLVVETPTPPPEVQQPVSGPLEGFLYGTGQGLLLGTQFALEMGSGMGDRGSLTAFVWFALGAAAITVCTVGGGFAGPFLAMPAEEARRRVRTIEAALLETRLAPAFEAALRDAVHTVRPGILVVPLGSHADATLVVRVSGYGLVGASGFDPPVAVAVRAETSWLSPGQQHRADFLHLGPSRGIVQWSDHPRSLRDELRSACNRLARRIAEERLLVEVVR